MNLDKSTPDWCLVSVSRRHDAKRDGHCRWCGYKSEMPIGQYVGKYPSSELDIAYDRTYNPDYLGDDKVPRNREY